MKRLQYLRSVKGLLSEQAEDCLHMNIYVPIEDGERFEVVPSHFSYVSDLIGYEGLIKTLYYSLWIHQ